MVDGSSVRKMTSDRLSLMTNVTTAYGIPHSMQILVRKNMQTTMCAKL